MKPRIFRSSLAFLLVCVLAGAALCGCAAPGPDPGTALPNGATAAEPEKAAEDFTVTDCLGNTLDFTNAPQRVVCLEASLSEIWLNAGGSFVGVSDDMADRGFDAGDATIIGDVKHPNTELILSLDPDLVIYSPDLSGHQETAQVLAEAGIPLYAAKVETLQDYLDVLSDFCQLNGNEEAYRTYGEAVATRVQATIDAVPKDAAPTVLFLRAYSSGVKAKASDHPLCYILDDLHAVNVAAQNTSLLEDVNPELILAADPEYIFIVFMGGDNAEAQAALDSSLTSNPAWSSLTAVRNGHVYYLPTDLFHYKANQRYDQAYAYIFDILYPQG